MFEKSYKYVICLLVGSCAGDFIEGEYFDGDGMPVCADVTVAKHFNTVDEAHDFAKGNHLKLGDYSLHGYYM